MKYSWLKSVFRLVWILILLHVSMASAEPIYHDHAELLRDGFFPKQEPVELMIFRGESLESYLISQFEARAELIEVSQFNLTPDAFRLAYTHLIDGRPDLFHVPSEWDYWLTDRGTVKEIKIVYLFDEAETERRKQAFNDSVAKVVKRASQSRTALGKIMLVHDYLCVNFTYDQASGIYSAEEMFRTGKGLCQGYLQCFQAVMNALNIPCVPVTSEQMKHGWNAVCVDGSWYHMDVTWDDALPSYPLTAMHRNFLLSDQGIAATKTAHHSWSCAVKASSTKYDDWFWKELHTPVAVNDESMYYAVPIVEDGTPKRIIKAWNMNTSVTINICTYPVASVNGGGKTAAGFYPVCATPTHLYALMTDRVYAMPLEGGASALACAVSGDQYFWSAYFDGEKIAAYAAPLPNSAGEMITFSNSRAVLTISPNIAYLQPDESMQMNARLIPGKVNEYRWSSSKPSVASVDETGRVTAVSPGVAVIKADYAEMLSSSRAVVVYSGASTKIPSGTTVISASAFQGSGVMDVILPEGLLTIGEKAFADCSGLYYVNLPASLTSIAENAFENTTGVVFVCKQGTAAEAYVKKMKFSYVSLP